MASIFSPVLEILPTRVRRNYRGGALLEQWTRTGNGRDGDQPEDWIASTTCALNPGLPPIANEGITMARTQHQEISSLAALIAAAPACYLGEDHLRACGFHLGFLAKLLDSSIRLHVQAHPTAEFARRHMGSLYGKLEAYVILATRKNTQPCLRLGFQHAPSRTEWKRIIEHQDIPAMDACFEPIPLQVGDVWLVPGGMPHAIGEGVLMLEVMEPSDLVVRCEFEREGIVVPPAGRFMGRDLDFCLDIFDYREQTVEAVRKACQLKPIPLRCEETITEELVGPRHSKCFTILRETYPAPAIRRQAGLLELLLISSGSGTLECEEYSYPLRPSSRLILAAARPPVKIIPHGREPLEILVCQPRA